MASMLLFLLQKSLAFWRGPSTRTQFLLCMSEKKKKQTTHQCKEKEEMRRGGQASDRSKPPSWSKDPASLRRSHFNEIGFKWLYGRVAHKSNSYYALCFEHVSSRKRWATTRPKWRANIAERLMLVLVVRQVTSSLSRIYFHRCKMSCSILKQEMYLCMQDAYQMHFSLMHTTCNNYLSLFLFNTFYSLLLILGKVKRTGPNIFKIK